MSTFIYGLQDPRTQEIRYVGQTSVGLSRPKAHSNPSVFLRYKSHVYNWVRQLHSEGLKPVISILEECESDELDENEIFYIGYLRSLGCNLTNLSTGGGGGARGTRWTEEMKDRQRAKPGPNRGRVFSEDVRLNMKEAALKNRGIGPITDQNGVLYASPEEAAARLGFKKSSIYTTLRDGRPLFGYVFNRAKGA